MSAMREAQLAMAAHLRQPAESPPPAGVEERRLQIYRDLVFNNIDNFIRSGFPVLHTLYSEADWRELVRAFVAIHRCETPLFPEIGQEFLDYLMQEHQARPCDPPFLLELAHYEWVELALDVAQEEVPPTAAGLGPADAIIFLSPLAWVLAYQYPVHMIGRDYRPESPSPTWLAVYRNPADEVCFLQLTAASARLLELLRGNFSGTREVIESLAGEMGMPLQKVWEYALQELRGMLDAGLVCARQGEAQSASD